MTQVFPIPPANTPQRTEFDNAVVGTLDRADGRFCCTNCRPPADQTDPCKVYGVNIAPYSATCKICGITVVKGAEKADGTGPLNLYV